MKYLLTILHSNQNQDNFINSIANEIMTLPKMVSPVNFCFGQEVGVLSFETNTQFNLVKRFFDETLGKKSIEFILTPIKTDIMSYWLASDHEKHLVGTNLCTTNEESEESDLESLIEQEIKSESYQEYLREIGVPEEVPSLDDLLDKINKFGMKSLTETEKKLLKQYSK